MSMSEVVSVSEVMALPESVSEVQKNLVSVSEPASEIEFFYLSESVSESMSELMSEPMSVSESEPLSESSDIFEYEFKLIDSAKLYFKAQKTLLIKLQGLSDLYLEKFQVDFRTKSIFFGKIT